MSRRLASRRFSLPALGWAVVLLIAIPTVVFVGADLFGGHLLLSGDNLIQTYPLRVLVGEDLRQGNLPSWDPWIWSGTPLLAGLNAGAFFPATFLFALFNAHAAWILGEVLVFSATGVGACLFFAESGMSPLGAFFGAAAFAFGGEFLTQASVHTDMADGLAALPWVLLAIRRVTVDGRWRWAVLLGGAFAWTILAGAPEAMLDIFVLALVYAAVRLSLDPGCWRRLVTRGVLGFGLAFGLTAALWVPAVHFLALSQRATDNMAFDSEFAFPSNALPLGLIPYLEGGLGLFSKAAYFGRSNQGEVSFYVGILPAIAALTMWTRAWRKRLPAGEQRCWYVVMLVGAFLAIVPGTPLERLFYYLPIWGQQRNAGRNIVDLDFAAAALFGWWVDRAWRGMSARSPRERLAGFIPFALVAAIGIWFAVSPTTLWDALVIRIPPPAGDRTAIGLALAVAACLAGLGGLLAALDGRLRRSTFVAAVGGLAVVDLALFAAGSSYAASSPVPTRSTPVLAIVRAHLSPGGRYAVFDPNLFNDRGLPSAAEADVGILTHTASVSGYGAIVDGTYSSVTGTHVRAGLKPASIEDGAFAPLGIEEIVAVPEAFILPVAALVSGQQVIRVVPEQPNSDPFLPWGSFRRPPHQQDAMIPTLPRPAISAGESQGWYFGEDLPLGRAVLSLGRAADHQLVRLGIVSPSGAVQWQPAGRLPAARRVSLTVDHEGIGLVISLLKGEPLGPVKLLVSAAGHPFLVAGSLAPAVTPEQWRPVGEASGFSVFRSAATPRPAWVEPATVAHLEAGEHPATEPGSGMAAPLGSIPSASARVTNSSPDATTITVHSPAPGLLVWSTAFDRGWHAEVLTAGGPQPVRVRRVGLVLGVRIGAGTTAVRFTYTPVGFATGVDVSLATLAVGVLATGFLLVLRRRRAAA